MTNSLGRVQAEAATAPHLAQDMIPLGLASGFGWLHLPKARRSATTGVVIASPIGREARCAHLPLRLLAERLASEGHPTLRYDHRSEGDAYDLAGDQDGASQWLADLEAAIDALRQTTGVERVVVCGLRLGGLLAAYAGVFCDGLILLAPPISGSAYVRELRLAATMGPVEAADLRGGLHCEGLTLSAETLKGLEALDLRTHAFASQPCLLMTPGPPSPKLKARLQAASQELVLADFPDYAGLFEDAHSNVPAMTMVERCCAWMKGRFAEQRATPQWGKIDWPQLSIGEAIERPVHFEGLWGVLTTPSSESRKGQGLGLAFCNTGGDPHYGIGRFSVQAARNLARLGVTSLRFDFAGLGDSPARDGALRSHVYETARQSDLAAAVALLRAEGCRNVALTGVCGGGYHAMHGALNAQDVDGAFVISTVRLIWKPGISLEVGRRDEGKATRTYFEGFGDLATWGRFVRGKIDVGAVMQTLTRRIGRRIVAFFDAQARDGLRTKLSEFSARGGRMAFLMGTDDAALDEMEAYFGANGGWLKTRRGLRMDVRPGLDHGLMTTWSRQVALERLSAFAAEFELAEPVTAREGERAGVAIAALA